MQIYNPKDAWHRLYFHIENGEVYRNTECALSEKDYESLCDKHGVNPLYPTLHFSKPFEEAPKKKITPRPPKQPKSYPKVYVADFKIKHQGDVFFIDSNGFQTPDFKIKLKLWKKRYGQENCLIIAKSIKDLEKQLCQ